MGTLLPMRQTTLQLTMSFPKNKDVMSVQVRNFVGSKHQGTMVQKTKVAILIQLSVKMELTERKLTRITNGLRSSASRLPHVRVVLFTMVIRRGFNGGPKVVTQSIPQGASAGIVTQVLPARIVPSVAMTSAHRRRRSEGDSRIFDAVGSLVAP